LKQALGRSEARVRQLVRDRERLTRDFHDDVIQAIYAVALELEECRAQAGTVVAARLSRIIQRLYGTMRDARGYIERAPRPTITGARFRAELARFAAARPRPHFKLTISRRAVALLSPEAAAHVLHIAREAVSNAVRHSRAERAAVSLQARGAEVVLEVTDDGAGFGAREKRHGAGLRNIESRAREIGATLEIRSSRGRGTTIIVRVRTGGPSALVT
jgi:signal transduction histidine kinase